MEDMAMEYAAVLFKPDSVRDVLEWMLLRVLHHQVDAGIVFMKYWRVQAWMGTTIYPAWVARREYPAMMRNLLRGPSLLTVLRGGPTLYDDIRRVKGKANLGGLRFRYRTNSIEAWRAMGYSGDALDDRIAENRLHATDTFDETCALCSLACTPCDLVHIAQYDPWFAAQVWRYRTLLVRP